MYTRKQYLNKECSHNEYYGQFVTPAWIDRVQRHIGADRVKRSTDPHLNDIHLKEWDNLATPFPASTADKMREAGDYPTLAGGICILKTAALQLIQ